MTYLESVYQIDRAITQHFQSIQLLMEKKAEIWIKQLEFEKNRKNSETIINPYNIDMSNIHHFS